MADPRFPRGTNPRVWAKKTIVLEENCVKMKEIGPWHSFGSANAHSHSVTAVLAQMKNLPHIRDGFENVKPISYFLAIGGGDYNVGSRVSEGRQPQRR